MRGIFFDEDQARSAAETLVRGGYAAEVVRERLAGEDDDEDHPWAVVTDAPEIQLDMLVEQYDGWLDYEDEEPAAPPLVLPLPDQPKRIKRPSDGG
ncbi:MULTISPECIES: hypothetical protein [unclassified Nocardioides]|uniref:hypothetical protein n=1 Tax=unclassified Nocardioides TaxID=2615069 RepID=UPI000702A861|nr:MULTISPECIES: hypothetical protein [unclassified Nocardioides]KRC55018.1 hypothetical protein ASE19_06135 [Nocardioides sp. Root79]KRC72015.1 hypothetical protein ASE20_05000 [Nocardioides sp. Root240]